MNPLSLILQQVENGDSTASTIVVIFVVIIGLVVFAIYIASLVWVYRDANRRGKSGILVALLVAIISWPLGLLVWVLVRDKV